MLVFMDLCRAVKRPFSTYPLIEMLASFFLFENNLNNIAEKSIKRIGVTGEPCRTPIWTLSWFFVCLSRQIAVFRFEKKDATYPIRDNGIFCSHNRSISQCVKCTFDIKCKCDWYIFLLPCSFYIMSKCASRIYSRLPWYSSKMKRAY